MKASAVQALRRKLASDEAAYGLWVTLESASISEMAVALGLDWVAIDAEQYEEAARLRDLLRQKEATDESG